MQYDEILDALGDGTRRDILAMIRQRPRSVGELAGALPVSQPAVSQHLRVLREARMVRVEKDGRRRIYHLRPEGFAPLRSFVSEYWDRALEAFRASFDDEREGADAPAEAPSPSTA